MSKVPWEERPYAVPGQRLGWANAAFDAAGYQPQVVRLPDGSYVIVVTVPASFPQELDLRNLPPVPRRGVRVNPTVVLYALGGLILIYMLASAFVRSGGLDGGADNIMAGLRGAGYALGTLLMVLMALGSIWLLWKLAGPTAAALRRARGRIQQMRGK